jgi:hypothetical protein
MLVGKERDEIIIWKRDSYKEMSEVFIRIRGSY